MVRKCVGIRDDSDGGKVRLQYLGRAVPIKVFE